MKPTVDVVIPVYNEENTLSNCVVSLRRFLHENLANTCRITVADNGSVDDTLAVAKMLAQKYPEVRYIHMEQKGRGRALRKSWLESDAHILSYMDVDLSTGLEAFPSLVDAIEQGYHIAIGTRLARAAKVTRSIRREIISRTYNILVKGMFFTHFSDAQCGFKAISYHAAHALLPHIKDTEWFFDSELLILAEKRGFSIKEVPVHWVEDPDSRVKIARTATQDIKGLLRLRFGGLPRITPPP